MGASALCKFTPPAFTGIHCTYPQKASQAELTWLAGVSDFGVKPRLFKKNPT